MTTDTRTPSPLSEALAGLGGLNGASIRKEMLRRRAPAEWNFRALNLDDFYRYCAAADITVYDRRLECPGIYLFAYGRPLIFISDELDEVERLFVGFHELAHHWLHRRPVQFFRGREEVVEVEADVVAACAMIPLALIERRRPLAYPETLFRLRREVFDRWRI